MSNINHEVVYAKSHEWLKVEGKKAKIGISDFAQHSLGAIVFVDLPEVGKSFAQGTEFGAIESVKAASEMFIPASGKVVAVNEKLVDHPELLNESPYGAWIVEIELKNPEELTKLLSPEAYAKIAV